MKHQLIMENWRNYLKEIDVTDPDTTRTISSPDPDLGKVKVSKEDFDNLRMVIGLFDPTGISAYPDVPPAIAAFKKNPSVLNAGILTAVLASAIPVLGKAGTAIKALLNLRKINNSLKQVKGSEKIVGKINSTLKELPSPEEIAEMRRIANLERADRRANKIIAKSWADFDLKNIQRSKFKDMDLGSDYARGELVPGHLVFIRSDWKPGMKPTALEHEWLTPKKINQSISPRLQKKFEEAQRFVRKQVADRNKTVNPLAKTVSVKPRPKTKQKALTYNTAPDTIRSNAPIPKKKTK